MFQIPCFMFHVPGSWRQVNWVIQALRITQMVIFDKFLFSNQHYFISS